MAMQVAKGIIAAVLGLLGLALVLLGLGMLATANAPIQNLHAEIRAETENGGLVDQTELPALENLAAITSDMRRKTGGLYLVFGSVALLPLTALWISSRRT